MNKIEKHLKLLNAITFLRSRWVGQGKLTATRIAWYAEVNLSTTQRQLRQMEEDGLIEKEIRDRDTKPKFSWFLTDKGWELLKSHPEFGWSGKPE